MSDPVVARRTLGGLLASIGPAITHRCFLCDEHPGATSFALEGRPDGPGRRVYRCPVHGDVAQLDGHAILDALNDVLADLDAKIERLDERAGRIERIESAVQAAISTIEVKVNEVSVAMEREYEPDFGEDSGEHVLLHRWGEAASSPGTPTRNYVAKSVHDKVVEERDFWLREAEAWKARATSGFKIFLVHARDTECPLAWHPTEQEARDHAENLAKGDAGTWDIWAVERDASDRLDAIEAKWVMVDEREGAASEAKTRQVRRLFRSWESQRVQLAK